MELLPYTIAYTDLTRSHLRELLLPNASLEMNPQQNNVNYPTHYPVDDIDYHFDHDATDSSTASVTESSMMSMPHYDTFKYDDQSTLHPMYAANMFVPQNEVVPSELISPVHPPQLWYDPEKEYYGGDHVSEMLPTNLRNNISGLRTGMNSDTETDIRNDIVRSDTVQPDYIRTDIESPNMQQYPDMTTMLNSNESIAAPLVEATFVDLKVCRVCGKRITRDMIRHMRTHETSKRFNCRFPRESCSHKTGQFNRRYDFKKHLLNKHFYFDNPNVRKVHNLSDKLNDWGTCPCGRRFLSGDWLENHILTNDPDAMCPELS